jgi:hypothetical protein
MRDKRQREKKKEKRQRADHKKSHVKLCCPNGNKYKYKSVPIKRKTETFVRLGIDSLERLQGFNIACPF